MTQSSYFLTNGSSLEDCHTNFFALADLCGIKWRQYICDNNYNDLSEDPILNSYSKCLGSDLLCVWRRVRSNTQDQTIRTVGESVYVNYSKELWIFWYGEEPSFSDLLSPNLRECETGSWETPGLSYECRTLLFKALHNLIERCLLSKGYARLGKWFFQVKPCDYLENKNKSDKLNEETQVTFAFNFFLHGDSNVCANVDVRQHSAVYRLSKEDIHTAQSSQGGIRVILAPYGLQGYLTGNIFKDTEPAVQKFLTDWKRIYPLINGKARHAKENFNVNIPSSYMNLNEESDANFLNKVVEVVVGDYRMKYPCCYVFVTGTDKQYTAAKLSMKNGKLTGSMANKIMQNIIKKSDEALENNKLLMTPYHQPKINDTYFLKNITNQAINFSDITLLNRIIFNRQDDREVNTTFYSDYLLQKECRCQKCQNSVLKKQKANNNNNNNFSGSSYLNSFLSTNKNKYERSFEKEKSKYLKALDSFHHRNLLNISQEVDLIFTLSYPNNDTSINNNGPATNNSQTNMNQSNVTPVMMPYKSPVSTSTSSILNTPGIETSPMSNFNIDGNEHISPINQAKDENVSINTPTNLINPSPKEMPCVEVRSPLTSMPSCDTINNINNTNSSSSNNSLINSNLNCINIPETKPEIDSLPTFESNENENPMVNMNESSPEKTKATKRLFLFESSYDDIDHDLRNGQLYDFTTESDNWNLPLPKNRRFRNKVNQQDFKISKEFLETFFRNEFSHLNHLESNDLTNFSSNASISKSSQNNNIVEVDHENYSIVMENQNLSSTDIGLMSIDKSTSFKMVNGYLGSKNNLSHSKHSRDDDFMNTFSDIDFLNSSGDDSSDNFHGLQINRNGHMNSHDTDSILNTINTSILGPAELSIMFPTPPSLEAMVSSPMGSYITSDSNKNDKMEMDNVDKNEQIHSVQVESDAKDWSFVYRPPMQSTFITAPKYAPLENLELKSSLPSSLSYKYSTKRSQSFKQCSTFHPYSNNSTHQTNNAILPVNKAPKSSSYHLITPNKINQAMMRTSRPLPPPINGVCTNRPIRPPLHLNQPPMYHDNYSNSNFRQNSPMLNMDNNNFIQSPAFEHKPFSFQQPSFTSPSNGNPMTPNGMMNNFMDHYRGQQKMSPMINNNQPNIFPSHNTSLDKSLNSTITMPNETNSLMLNLLLSDSMFNLFRDHNFESCSICVCNMNIKGNDVGIYIPDSSSIQPQNNYDYCQCTCGFSALTNRHLSQFSGLFYEDETEITSIFYDPSEKANCESENNLIDKDLKKALSEMDENFINLLITQSTNIFSSCSTLSRVMHYESRHIFRTFDINENSFKLFERDPQKLVYIDCCTVTLISLNMARIEPTGPTNLLLMKPASQILKSSKPVLHEWAFRKATFPTNNHEIVYVLKSLQPLMKESIQRKGSIKEVTYNTVNGPLTWRQFHSLAGRTTEYMCEPQPIPSLMAGHDKDCVIVSPFALKFWEKLSLEPYAIARDVAYVVITPSDEYILSCTKNFFKELSTTYEVLRLGHHIPLTKLFSDGICPVETSYKTDFLQLDDWFNQLGESRLASIIKLYAQACFYILPNLTSYDKSLFENNQSFKGVNSHYDPNVISSQYHNNGANAASSTGSNLNNNNNNNNTANNSSSYHNTSSSNNLSQFNSISQRPPMQSSYSHMNNINETTTGGGGQLEKQLTDVDNHGQSSINSTLTKIGSMVTNYDEDDNIHRYPGIVIYMVEPFTCLDEETGKLGCIGLFKAFSQMLTFIPESLRNNVHLQLISVNSILSGDKDIRNIPRNDQMKNLAFSVYSLCKQQLFIRPNIKSLTGLGPAASFDMFLKTKEPFYNITQLYTTPFILAPLKDKQTELGEMFGDRREKTQTMFCSYCLTEDQKWLITSCTNDKGDILQAKIINIHVPNRLRRRNASVRRYGLNKLMKFLQTVMSESVMPWRLVIGRLGRIGHGELKEWTFLLSKKSLLKFSRQLREMCAQCRELLPNDQPAIHSACLISLEADSSLRVFPNHFTPDERFSSSCNTCSLSTPEDATCTHILVFPTPATTQSQHTNFSSDILGTNLGECEEFFTNLDDPDMPDEFDFGNFWNESLLDPRDGTQPDSPGNRQGGFGTSSSLKNSNNLDMDDHNLDEPAQLSLQPLALAFYVSTAPTGPLPRWFWANCPHLENTCPSFLKSALLIHTPFVQQNSDDLLHNNRDCHSLDSSLTTDVLRYALEYYNSLSWLILDPSTNDRMSCLPLHIQVMMQLYHTLQALT